MKTRTVWRIHYLDHRLSEFTENAEYISYLTHWKDEMQSFKKFLEKKKDGYKIEEIKQESKDGIYWENTSEETIFEF